MITERKVLLSLGANIEPVNERLDQAVSWISDNILSNCVQSAKYKSPPLGYTLQADFVNLAMVGTSTDTTHSIHLACKGLEVSLGRQHRDLWREREIDIDIIVVGQEIVADLMLTVPHPRFRSRRFVLQPAADIAPDMVDPITGFTISQLLQQCQDSSILTRL